ncbi:MAG: P-loop containing nucleoside triphosphate hydrolase, partial [Paenibacillus sp.]|nr:P-loop containing nucleoside triphosphate hydrolase [Paenibacillus sp.]
MHKLQLAVAARDKEYVKRLAGYIRESAFGDRWQLTAFTSANSCKHYLKQGYGIDILVAEPDLAKELREHAPSTPIVVLTDRLGTGGGRELLRYQALPLFMGALEDFCRADTGSAASSEEAVARLARASRGSGEGGATVVAIHSAAGGIGKTTFALHAAAAAAVAGLRACYVNLERWAIACDWQENERDSSGVGLSELLYRVKAGSALNAEQMANCCKYSSLLKCDYIPGFANPEDRLTLSGEDAVAIADFIAATGRYDLIILDLDNEWNAMQLALLARSDLVYEIVRNERDVIGKQQQAMRYALQTHVELYGKVLPK